MTRELNTVVVGGGQTGLSVSHYLAEHRIEHVILEQAADRIAERRTAIGDAHATSIVPQGALHAPERSAATGWADHVTTLIWLSALSLTLDGFAGYAAGIYPTTPENPRHQADSAFAPTDATPRQR